MWFLLPCWLMTDANLGGVRYSKAYRVQAQESWEDLGGAGGETMIKIYCIKHFYLKKWKENQIGKNSKGQSPRLFVAGC